MPLFIPLISLLATTILAACADGDEKEKAPCREKQAAANGGLWVSTETNDKFFSMESSVKENNTTYCSAKLFGRGLMIQENMRDCLSRANFMDDTDTSNCRAQSRSAGMMIRESTVPCGNLDIACAETNLDVAFDYSDSIVRIVYDDPTLRGMTLYIGGQPEGHFVKQNP